MKLCLPFMNALGCLEGRADHGGQTVDLTTEMLSGPVKTPTTQHSDATAIRHQYRRPCRCWEVLCAINPPHHFRKACAHGQRMASVTVTGYGCGLYRSRQDSSAFSL